MAITPLPGGYTGEGEIRKRTVNSLSWISPCAAPAPQEGGWSAKRRGGGGYRESPYATETGEAGPPPRRPLPQWRYSHGPLYGEILEKGWVSGSLPGHGFPPDIATHCPRPLEGGGGAPKVRVGWGIIEESYGAETGRARTRQRQGRGAGPPYPSSNDVTPKISSRGRSGTAFVYIRAVSKTGTIPCRRASATAAAFGSGVSM